MQINAASLLAAQQARTPSAPARPAAKPSDDLFEPLFGKAEAAPVQASKPAAPVAVPARPGSTLDIRV
ncbi:MAG: hypothetical protein ACTHLR_11335 [Rhizomicrobium sp.]